MACISAGCSPVCTVVRICASIGAGTAPAFSSESSARNTRRCVFTLSRTCAGVSAIRAGAGRCVRMSHTTLCKPGCPGPVSARIVSPLASCTIMRT